MKKSFVTINSLILILSALTIVNGCDNNTNNYRYYNNCKSKTYIKPTNDKKVKRSANNYNSKDTHLKNRLYGRWKKILKQRDGSILYVTTNFYRDGKFYTSAIKKRGNIQKTRLYSKGDWYIKNRYLIEKTKYSNYATKGSITRDKIILITNKQFVYKTQKGKVFTYYRK